MLQDLLLISTAFCVALVIFLLSENLDLHKKQREIQNQIDTLKKEIENLKKNKKELDALTKKMEKLDTLKKLLKEYLA